MATVKNFGLAGVSADVQWGKGGGRIAYEGGTHFTVRDSAGSALIETYGATPTGSSDVNTLTTKEYVDSVASGLDPKESVIAATTQSFTTQTGTAPTEAGVGVGHTLTNAGTQAAFAVDGVTFTVGQRVLVKNEAAALEVNNGIYTVTTVGSGATNWVLTRATDQDGTPANEVSGGNFTFVESGTSQADTGWVVSSPTGNAVVETTPIVWTQFSSAGLTTVSGTASRVAVVQTGNDFNVDIDAAYVGQASITTLGTITSGTWQGTTVAVSQGGTGQTVADDIVDAGTARITVTGGLTSVFNGGTNVTLDVNEANLDLNAIGGLLDLTAIGAQVTGILPVPNGGTGLGTITSNGIMFGNTAGAVGVTAAGAEGQLLRAGATGTPAFTTATFPATVAASATSASILVANTSNTVTELTAIQAGGDQLLQFNSTTGNMEYVTTASVGGFKFSTIAGDTGSAVADAVADTITMIGGAGITTVAASTPDSVTFDLDSTGLTVLTGATLVAATDQIFVSDGGAGGVIAVTTPQAIVDAATINIFTGITGDTGFATVDSETDSLNFAGAEGIVTTASDISGVADVSIALDLNEIPAAVPIAGDELIFADGGATNGKRAISSFLTDFAIVVDGDFASQGIMTSDGAGNYAQRSIVESTTAAQQGAQVNNGTGTANIEIGIDINNLTASAVNMDATDEFIVFDGINNVSITGQQIADGVAALGNDDRIVSPDTFTTAIVDNTGKLVISTENVATTGSNTFATFDTTVDGPQYNFTNALGEISLQAGDAGGFAGGSTGNVDIRFEPGLNGEVIFGAAGTNATLTSSSGTAGENFVILAGDGTAGAGGNVTITPGTGTTTNGNVCITDDLSVNVMCFEGVASAVNYISLTNAAAAGNPVFSVVGTANQDMGFLGAGTGVLTVTGTTNYEVQVTDDDDIPNKKYVDDADAGVLSGSTGSFKFTVDLTALGNFDPATSTIPAGATVLRVLINVTGASDAATTLTIGTTAGGAEYAAAATNDPEAAGLYAVDLMSGTVGALRAVVATPSAGAASADVVVEYKNA